MLQSWKPVDEVVPSSDIPMPADTNIFDDLESSGSGKSSSDWEDDNVEFGNESGKLFRLLSIVYLYMRFTALSSVRPFGQS